MLLPKLHHNKSKCKVPSIADFTFRWGAKNFHWIFGTAYWEKETKGGLFIETTLKTAINHLIGNCYSDVGNMTMKQSTGIPMGNEHAPFWASLFLYSYKEE